MSSVFLGRGEQAFPTSKKREESLPFGQSREFWVNIVLKRLRTTAFIMFHGVLPPSLVIVKKAGFSVLSKGALLTPAGRLRN